MSKKSVKKTTESQALDFLDEFMLDDYMEEDYMEDDYVPQIVEAVKGMQNTALELTKLALAYAKNIDENKVFELFSRAMEEISGFYKS